MSSSFCFVSSQAPLNTALSYFSDGTHQSLCFSASYAQPLRGRPCHTAHNCYYGDEDEYEYGEDEDDEGEGDEGDEDDYDDHDDGHYDDHDNDKSNSGKQLVRYSASDRNYSDTASRRSRSTVRHAPRTERSYRPSERSYRNSHCGSYGDYDGGASRRTGNSGKQLIRNHGGSNSRPASIYSGAISHRRRSRNRNRNRNSSKQLARYSASDRNYSATTSQATRSNHHRSSCSNAGKHLTRCRAPLPHDDPPLPRHTRPRRFLQRPNLDRVFAPPLWPPLWQRV